MHICKFSIYKSIHEIEKSNRHFINTITNSRKLLAALWLTITCETKEFLTHCCSLLCTCCYESVNMVMHWDKHEFNVDYTTQFTYRREGGGGERWRWRDKLLREDFDNKYYNRNASLHADTHKSQITTKQEVHGTAKKKSNEMHRDALDGMLSAAPIKREKSFRTIYNR